MISLKNDANLNAAQKIAAKYGVSLKRRNEIGRGAVVYLVDEDGERTGVDYGSGLAVCEALEAQGYDTSICK